MKIKFSIFLIFLFSIFLIFPQAAATTVELSTDKENYKLGEIVHVTLDLKPTGSVTGSLAVFKINETNKSKSAQYGLALLGTGFGGCLVVMESIDSPIRKTFDELITEPGNYYAIAHFEGIEKKIFFNVLAEETQETQKTTVELSIDKENYKVGETIHVTIDLNSDESLSGGITIYAVITETKSKEYVQLFGTVPCSSCAGGRPESIDVPFHETFHRQMNDPGNYYVIATFGGVEKKIFFNVSGFENALNETGNETAENETANKNKTTTPEVNQTGNITEINGTINAAINATENSKNKSEIKKIIINNKTETKITEKQPADNNQDYVTIILIIILLVIVISIISIIISFVKDNF